MTTATESAATFLRELADLDLLPNGEDGIPDFATRARRLAFALDPIPRPHPGYDPDHPLVRCLDCESEFTACDLGNHYCPSCGESAEDAEEVRCSGCPCVEQGASPCCYCGATDDAHVEVPA